MFNVQLPPPIVMFIIAVLMSITGLSLYVSRRYLPMKMKSAYLKSITVLAAAVETKDSGTVGHAQRVAQLTVEIGAQARGKEPGSGAHRIRGLADGHGKGERPTHPAQQERPAHTRGMGGHQEPLPPGRTDGCGGPVCCRYCRLHTSPPRVPGMGPVIPTL